MSEINKHFDKIESYLKNNMTDEERKAFEDQLLTDKELSDELQQHRFEHQVMNELVKDDLRSDLKNWQEVIDLSSKDSIESDSKIIPFYRNSSFQYIAIAASFALLAAVFIWYSGDDTRTQTAENRTEQTETKEESKTGPEETETVGKSEIEGKEEEQKTTPQKPQVQKNLLAVAESNYTEYDFTSIPGVNIRGSKNPVDLAIEHFANGNFSEGEKELLTLIDAGNPFIEVYYYLGLGYYNERNYEKAIEYFNMVVTSDEYFVEIEEAQWRLSIAYLFEEEDIRAKRLLKSIIQNQNHKYYTKAVKIMKDLKL